MYADICTSQTRHAHSYKDANANTQAVRIIHVRETVKLQISKTNNKEEKKKIAINSMNTNA